MTEKKLQKKIQSIEKDITKLKLEQKKLFDYFLKHPTGVNHEKSKRLTEIEIMIRNIEEEWLQTHEKLL